MSMTGKGRVAMREFLSRRGATQYTTVDPAARAVRPPSPLAVAISFDAVAVGIDGERGVVVGIVIRAHARLAVVASAHAHRRGVKRVDALARRGREAEMHPRFAAGRQGAAGGGEPQRDLAVAVSERGL